MIGLIGLAIAGLYIAFWIWVVKAAKNRNAKALATIIALAIPFWDLPIGYYNFIRHCSADGGIREIEKVQLQRTLYFASGAAGPRPEYLIKSGLEQVEYQKDGGKGVIRYFKDRTGHLQAIEERSPTSALQVRATFNENTVWNVYRHERVLQHNDTGRKLAQARAYTWRGGWIQARTHPILTPMATCHESSLTDLISLAITGERK